MKPSPGVPIMLLRQVLQQTCARSETAEEATDDAATSVVHGGAPSQGHGGALLEEEEEPSATGMHEEDSTNPPAPILARRGEDAGLVPGAAAVVADVAAAGKVRTAGGYPHNAREKEFGDPDEGSDAAIGVAASEKREVAPHTPPHCKEQAGVDMARDKGSPLPAPPGVIRSLKFSPATPKVQKTTFQQGAAEMDWRTRLAGPSNQQAGNQLSHAAHGHQDSLPELQSRAADQSSDAVRQGRKRPASSLECSGDAEEAAQPKRSRLARGFGFRGLLSALRLAPRAASPEDEEEDEQEEALRREEEGIKKETPLRRQCLAMGLEAMGESLLEVRDTAPQMPPPTAAGEAGAGSAAAAKEGDSTTAPRRVLGGWLPFIR